MRNREEFEARRDAKLRRAMLFVLYLTMQDAPLGEISGESLKTQADLGMSDDMGFVDDAHVIRLAREMVHMGLAEERLGTIRRGERLSLRHLAYKITHKGMQLHLEQIPPVPGVDDERIHTRA